MKLTGRIDDVSVSLTGKPKLTLVINEKSDLLCGYDDLKHRKAFNRNQAVQRKAQSQRERLRMETHRRDCRHCESIKRRNLSRNAPKIRTERIDKRTCAHSDSALCQVL